MDHPGDTIGHYHLIERLGAGGMAAVYRAYDAAQNCDVAVKVLPIHLAANDTLKQRFMREAQMAARLQHPHILPIYDFGEDRGVPFIVMKLVEGGTLDDRIQQEGPLQLRMASITLIQAAEALDYAHSQGVIHRDIKPENILFDTNGHLYLADFGLARLYEGGEQITGTGGFVGTAAYASPEQCRGEELSPASDIYSLGVVLYEMLTGVLPFSGPTPLAIMHKHMSEPVPNPLKDRSDLPIGIAEIMRKALAKLVSIRYQTATAMSNALLDVLRREVGTRPLVGVYPPMGPNPVFDKPSTAYAPPPPIPDEFLRGLERSEPLTRSATRRMGQRGTLPIRPLQLTPPHEPEARDHTTLYVFLLLVVIVLIIGAATLVLVSH